MKKGAIIKYAYIASLIIALSAIALIIVSPETIHVLSKEGAAIENMQVVLIIASAYFFFASSKKNDNKKIRIFLIIVGVLMVMNALEEIDWGSRFVESNIIDKGKSATCEESFNLHSLCFVTYILGRDIIFHPIGEGYLILLVIYFVLLPFTYKNKIIKCLTKKTGLVLPPKAFAAIIMAGLILTLFSPSNFGKGTLGEETADLLFSITLLAFSFLIYKEAKKKNLKVTSFVS